MRRFGVLALLVLGSLCGWATPVQSLDIAFQNRTTTSTSLRLSSTQVVFAEDTSLQSACAGISDCGNCSNTYTCHWCQFDQGCHARGSVHGCSWGTSCNNKPKPPSPPKENTTCSSHATCSDCALASRFCHWCEHDNSCHSIGSPYGCSVGVDCYSNDRCRRSEPETFHRGVIFEIPRVALALTLCLGVLFVTCLSCCHFCFVNVKGAYDDLATITAAASLPPSVIGGTLMGPHTATEPFYSSLETHLELDDEEEGAVITQGEPGSPSATEAISAPQDEEAPSPEPTPTAASTHAAPAMSADPTGTSSDAATMLQPQEGAAHQRPLELESDPNDLLLVGPHDDDGPMTPLLHRHLPSSAVSFNGIPGMEEPRHMKALYKMCTCLYCMAVLLVFALVFVTLYLFPKPSIYNVCNNAVAWKKIIGEMVELKLDAPIEILISVSNPNHLTVVLDRATGSFAYEGKHVGTYEIPPAVVEGMAVTDMMLIAQVTPDKYQAVQLAEAYTRGKLVLQADFRAKLRAPALFDMTYDVHLTDIPVYVNDLGPRDLCHCPSWDRSHAAVPPSLAQSFADAMALN